MLKQACLFCKIVGAVAIMGALNWGWMGASGVNILENVLGDAVRWAYILIGLSGFALLVSFFMVCPACKK